MMELQQQILTLIDIKVLQVVVELQLMVVQEIQLLVVEGEMVLEVLEVLEHPTQF
tara:strand:- start:209 stop:373 length:165 start_codon:yes stop_codon:yes gene_type:complete